jgi:hypothetical protein
VNGKEIFLAALRCERAERLPVAPHWWGVWKYEALGLPFPASAWRDGAELAHVYFRFQERFHPDWLHLHIGTPRWLRNAEILRYGTGFARPSVPGSVGRLIVDPAQRARKREDRYLSVSCGDDEEITDFADYLLASRVRRPKVDLSDPCRIDDYVRSYVAMSADEVEELGYTDHLGPVVDRFGAEALVAVHLPSPVCEIFDPSTGYLGFENGLMAFHDQPDGMKRLLQRCYAAQLEWARAYARAGADAFVISESYVSPDLVHPSIYRSYLSGLHRDYFTEVERMGLVPMCDFWGDVNPILDELAGIGIRALLIEEGKKGFGLPVREIRERLGGRVALFGNIDSLGLLRLGTPDDVRAAVEEQASGATAGFISANGSPIAPTTPAANVEALIAAGRAQRPDAA